MKEEFKKRLLVIARRRASQSYFDITTSAEKDLKKFIDDGLDKTDTADLDSEHKRNLAESSLLKLIDLMTIRAAENSDKNLNIKIFLETKTSLCPLWPFC
jgi:hypothetical protein